jgi:hypothetical protein
MFARGTRIGYQILDPPGAGGMGEVYRAPPPIDVIASWFAELARLVRK